MNQPMSCISASVVSNGAIRLWVRSGLIAGSISRFLNAIGSQWLSVDPATIGVLAYSCGRSDRSVPARRAALTPIVTVTGPRPP